MSEEAKRSRVLVVGATGRLGGSLIRASLAAGHPTFALVRPHHLALPDSAPLKPLAGAGATLLKGSLEDYPSLLEAVRQVDVVICAVPTKQALEQKALIRAIKEAECVQRFIPAEFGLDPTKVQICDMDHGFYDKKAEIRRLIESEGIPHTYICCNFFMRYLLPSLVQPGLDAPPRDEVKIFGGGNTKGVFVKESDVAKFTMCTIEDPRTLNKTLYLRPPGNVYSMNELVGLWEKKINKFLKKIYITEEQLLKNIDESEGIPHTYICCNFFMRYLLPSLVQPGLDAPPRDEVKIFGGGNTKGVFVKESDVAKFTMCTIEDPRTLNKTLYLRPPGNVYSMNELVGLWEKKINKFLKKIYITEEQLLKNIDDAPFPLKMDLVFIYSAFVKGDHTYFEIDSRIEGTQLYPYVNYTTVNEYLDTLV